MKEEYTTLQNMVKQHFFSDVFWNIACSLPVWNTGGSKKFFSASQPFHKKSHSLLQANLFWAQSIDSDTHFFSWMEKEIMWVSSVLTNFCKNANQFGINLWYMYIYL